MTDLINKEEVIEKTVKICSIEALPYHGYSYSGNLETSQNGLVSAAIGSTLCQKRALITTNNNLGEEMHRAAIMRIPVVSIILSNTMGVMTENKNEENALSYRDSGCLIAVPENNQEMLDTMILMYRVCEDNKIMLPGIISVDNKNLREPVQCPSDKTVKGVLPDLKLKDKIDVKNPKFIGEDVNNYLEKRKNIEEALEESKKMIEKASEMLKEKTKRNIGMKEEYKIEDADYIFVTYGEMSSNGKVAVDKLREEGEKVGLIRLLFIRPLPDITTDKKFCVVERNYSSGKGGIVWNDIGKGKNYICEGTEKDFRNALKLMKSEEEKGWSI